jgi:hypothetical protein
MSSTEYECQEISTDVLTVDTYQETDTVGFSIFSIEFSEEVILNRFSVEALRDSLDEFLNN